ncbi:hypothetical protein HRbin02_00739 [Candidatus Calditenuaceae archaeon HR02]|nr:hypothetical protein HRbin02_00739 [Candidatus Calditenuaceae archaeon HR02]
MVEKVASAAVDALIEKGVRELLERTGKRRLTAQDLTLLLLYDLRARTSRTEEAVRLGFEEMNKRLDTLTTEIRSFREDMKPLWNALAKLIEAQTKT